MAALLILVTGFALLFAAMRALDVDERSAVIVMVVLAAAVLAGFTLVLVITATMGNDQDEDETRK